ncbi:hypothetical protein MGS_05904 [Candida albicans P78042]|nr:hypothetical protein MGK_05888 [Candida albicans P57055]KHC65182.1 hypothetical protein MGS_05904 [Candida albicans P78042]
MEIAKRGVHCDSKNFAPRHRHHHQNSSSTRYTQQTINQKNRNREIRHHLILPTPPSSSSSCFLFSYLLAYAFYSQTLSRTTFPFGILAKKSNFKT